MKEVMKEVVVVEPYKFEVREVPIPEPDDNQVQIKMMAAGVCGSDIHIFKGKTPIPAIRSFRATKMSASSQRRARTAPTFKWATMWSLTM